MLNCSTLLQCAHSDPPTLHHLTEQSNARQLCSVPVKWPALCLNYQLLGARYADERDVGGMGRGETKGENGEEGEI